MSCSKPDGLGADNSFVSPNIVLVEHEPCHGFAVKVRHAERDDFNNNRKSVGGIFKRGYVILEVDPIAVCIDGGFTTVPDSLGVGNCSKENRYRKVCNWCLSIAENNGLFPLCGNCQAAWFCSKRCQRKAWDKFHKFECSRLQRSKKIAEVIKKMNTATRSVRLLLIVISKLLNESQTRVEDMSPSLLIPCDTFRFPIPLKDAFFSNKTNQRNGYVRNVVMQMSPRSTVDKLERRDGRLSVCYIAAQLMNSENEGLDDINGQKFFKTVELLNEKFVQNTFSIVDHELGEVGVGLYPFASFFNHSCVPNCTVYFKSMRLLIIANRDIYEDEELTISYTDTIEEQNERLNTLDRQYNFTCQCFVCAPDSPLKNAYNKGFLHPTCPKCCTEIAKERLQNDADNTVFSTGWLKQIGLVYGRTSFSASSGIVFDGVLARIPASINKYLLKPPFMELVLNSTKNETSYNKWKRQCTHCNYEACGLFVDLIKKRQSCIQSELTRKSPMEELHFIIDAIICSCKNNSVFSYLEKSCLKSEHELKYMFYTFLDSYPIIDFTHNMGILEVVKELIRNSRITSLNKLFKQFFDKALYIANCTSNDFVTEASRLGALLLISSENIYGKSDACVGVLYLQLAKLQMTVAENQGVSFRLASEIFLRGLQLLSPFSSILPIVQVSDTYYKQCQAALEDPANRF